MDTPKTTTWVVTKIIEAKKDLVQVSTMQTDLTTTLANMVKQGNFQIQKACIQILLQFPKVGWKSIHIHLQVHPRFKFHLWLALHQKLATVDRLLKYGIQVSQESAFCAKGMKTFSHLFFECSSTSTVWDRILKWLGITRRIG